MKVKPPFKKI